MTVVPLTIALVFGAVASFGDFLIQSVGGMVFRTVAEGFRNENISLFYETETCLPLQLFSRDSDCSDL
jgi:hypothetical protein